MKGRVSEKVSCKKRRYSFLCTVMRLNLVRYIIPSRKLDRACRLEHRVKCQQDRTLTLTDEGDNIYAASVSPSVRSVSRTAGNKNFITVAAAGSSIVSSLTSPSSTLRERSNVTADDFFSASQSEREGGSGKCRDFRDDVECGDCHMCFGTVLGNAAKKG